LSVRIEQLLKVSCAAAAASRRHGCKHLGMARALNRSMNEAAELVEARPTDATGGPRIDFEAFYLERHEAVFSALWLVTRNRHEAEEIAQDAFLKLWERWDRVAGLEDPGGYLYRTAMNVWRSRGRRTAVAIRRAVRALPPDDGIAEVESRDAIVRALAPLTPRQRAALVLTDLLDFTSEEAGTALGIRASTVRVLAARARTTLQGGT
jgi:RNA polymerase sigma-70 factor (ECF subfamily)